VGVGLHPHPGSAATTADAKKVSEKNFEFFFQNVKAAVAAGEV
jgi:hypothetical protein